MRLTKAKILALWRMRKELFGKEENAYIKARFEAIKSLFDIIAGYDVADTDGIVSIDGTEVRFRDGSLPSRTYFSCRDDDMTSGRAFDGVKCQSENFDKSFEDVALRIGCMLGGFDFGGAHAMRAEYRILSNSVTGHDDNSSLISSGQVRHPASHFADNNYFFNVVQTIQDIKRDRFNPDNSRIVLRWPNATYYPKGDAEAEKSQRVTLKYRFPYKFFYMWTHEVIRPVSLLAYRELVRQQDAAVGYDFDKSMNQPYGDFKNKWKDYSQKILQIIPDDERGTDFWNELSLLLSIIMIRDQSIISMKELLDTGNKAIILYGPPGTGKTYHAEELVCQELCIDRADLEKHKFDAAAATSGNGAWTLVQFHPNYTYEDFIGGISPSLDGNSISYKLKVGIFKQLCDSASKPENQDKKFVIVIDEINRADLSSVFGELMYGLEYRGRTMTIPNFAEKFVIPGNVYIIGTMNSMDKSLVTFDLALRRRFAFYKVMPQISVLENMLADYNVDERCLSGFIARCKELNEKISNPSSPLRLNREYQIGHAYYGKIRDFLSKGSDEPQLITTFDLEKLWEYHLYPLLEEYLGSRIDDESIQKRLQSLMTDFTEDLV